MLVAFSPHMGSTPYSYQLMLPPKQPLGRRTPYTFVHSSPSSIQVPPSA